MTRQELKSDLKSRGKFDVNDGRDPSWQKAFQLYYQETRNKLSMSCGSCYTRLRNWMNS